MKIAVLSGKGGAGKTFVAVNLAAAAGRAVYVDCDVEEPNGRLFLKPEQVVTESVYTLLPEFDAEKCSGCRQCVDFCRFHALMFIKEKPIVFAEVCHSCGGCKLVCPEHAVSERRKEVGMIEIGKHNDLTVITGVLNPGEASGVAVINQALAKAEKIAAAGGAAANYTGAIAKAAANIAAGTVAVAANHAAATENGALSIIDCPPGSACSVMESIMDADFCVLVAEPTAFGFHNFQMVYELATLLGRKCGVVINKQTDSYEPLESFCRERELPILERISYHPELASKIARGEIASEIIPSERERFQSLLKKIKSTEESNALKNANEKTEMKETSEALNKADEKTEVKETSEALKKADETAGINLSEIVPKSADSREQQIGGML